MGMVYEGAFDANEWFVLVNLMAAGILIWKLPKKLSGLETAVHFTIGIFTGMFFDHTISIKPWDFYDVNDTSDYQFIDLLSYIMYGPYSYIFIYLYVKLNVKGHKNILYVTIWTIFAVLIEWFSVKLGIFHYEKGYQISWSFPIYGFFQTLQIMFYKISLKMENVGKLGF
ncbi:hypothetical protein AF332_18750 [Sporosarcina globispora]|uniref:Uncharacterized protein n=1 Tax=Sporosarcina globispora TaxID=1459 RepID=A0A0M0GFE5_SPOGL|nr:hypothetical protein [Sporosarcina globispora]KON88645.1 hypothetical protein AF332_18750 [Sporosarcina globispora]